MLNEFVTNILAMLLGYAYPAFECFKMMEIHQVDLEKFRFWCQYWVIIAIVTVFERFFDIFVSWLPLYAESKLAFFIYLWHPKTQGTSWVYAAFLRPLVAQHESEIEDKLKRFRAKSGELLMFYIRNFTDQGRSMFLELLHLVAQQPNPFTPSARSSAGEQPRPVEPSAPPYANPVRPDPVHQSPYADQTRPSAANQSPYPNQTRPNAASQSPYPNQTRPNAASQSPYPNQTRPNAASQSPYPNQTRPNAASQSPYPNQTRPNAANQSPYPDQTRLNAANQSPYPDQTRHDATNQSLYPNLTRPNATNQSPYPNQNRPYPNLSRANATHQPSSSSSEAEANANEINAGPDIQLNPEVEQALRASGVNLPRFRGNPSSRT